MNKCYCQDRVLDGPTANSKEYPSSRKLNCTLNSSKNDLISRTVTFWQEPDTEKVSITSGTWQVNVTVQPWVRIKRHYNRNPTSRRNFASNSGNPHPPNLPIKFWKVSLPSQFRKFSSPNILFDFSRSGFWCFTV